jgi:putative transcription factor
MSSHTTHHQDFKEIVFKKKTEKKTNAPQIEISKKDKLLNSDELPTLKTFGKENAMILQQARLAMKLTQDSLAKSICEQKNLINQYETGNIIPDQKVLNKLRKRLNIKFKN